MAQAGISQIQSNVTSRLPPGTAAPVEGVGALQAQIRARGHIAIADIPAGDRSHSLPDGRPGTWAAIGQCGSRLGRDVRPRPGVQVEVQILHPLDIDSPLR